MTDFIFGAASMAGLIYIIHHFRADPAKAKADFLNLETRIKQMIADALNELKAAADAHEAKAVADAVAAATAPAVAAQEATDEQTVRDFTAANFPTT